MLIRSLIFTILVLIASLTTSGCATRGALTISNLDRPLIDLQRIAVKSMPLGLRKTSANGREYMSNYFVARERKFRPAEKDGERYYAHILVLGDRRPYSIEVIVRHEKRNSDAGGAYQEIGLDQGLAKVVRSRVLNQLNKRREELNIIDDFRVF